MTKGLLFDAAFAPDLAKVKAAGGIAMSVYLTGHYASSCAQPAALHKAGLGALGNYEEMPGEMVTGGHAAGLSAGRRAAAAYASKGAPPRRGLGIAFSVDVDVPASKFPAVADAFAGIKAGLDGSFVPHVYGEGALIDYLFEHHGVLGLQWLSASKSYPGWNPSDEHVGLVQYIGSPVSGTDRDEITNLAGLGIWWPPGSPYETENGMAMDADVKERFDAIDAEVAGIRKLFEYQKVDGTTVTGTVQGIVAGMLARLVSPSQIAAAVVAALPQGGAAPLSEADVETAVRNVLENGVGA